MPATTDDKENQSSKRSNLSKSRLKNLISQYSFNTSTMLGLKMKDHCKTAQVYAYTPSDTTKHNHPTISYILSNPIDSIPNSTSDSLLPYGFPRTDSIEPQIEPFLKPVDFVDSLAELHRKIEKSPDKSSVYLEQYALFSSIGDPKLLRRCLQSARKFAVDAHFKVVFSAWLRYERREDEIVGKSGFDCIGKNLECPKSALINGYDPDSIFDRCNCSIETKSNDEISRFSSLDDSDSVCFCIFDERVYCSRSKIALLSQPLRAMLYGGFTESGEGIIDFSHIGISVEGMRGVSLFAEGKRVDSFSIDVILEILSFANRFCCEEMKSSCDSVLSLLVSSIDEALILIDYAIEERAYLFTASCLQVIIRELPHYLYNSKVMTILCSFEGREKLDIIGHASFSLYYFLSHVSMEDNMKSNVTVMLLERLRESATENWQKGLSFHQSGCVFLERKDYENALRFFEAAVETGHVYSVVGVARIKYKLGQRFLAYETINSIMSKYDKPTGWMYQERSMYISNNKKIPDLNEATRLDPTLEFPYKYRAIDLLENNSIKLAISEISRILGFKVSSGCLEIRSWLHIINEDYDSAIRDIRSLLTLESNYMVFNGKVRGDYMVRILSEYVDIWSPADCWMQLYDRWSAVDDIGSLAVIHRMVEDDPENSVLRFRQSLLLLRLNCQKAAMRSLRSARNHSTSEYERLVYEGWVLYDTGHRELALSKSEESILIQRSFEAFFLKAYALADSYLNPESATCVIQLLEEALKCPSDGLRKGQALNNLGSIYVDCGKLDLASDCYVNALKIKHTRAHQGLARVYHLQNQRKSAYDEMTKLIDKAQNKGSAHEKRSEYCDRELANNDLSIATQLDPMRTYPYRYRAAVFMDDQRENEALEELTKAISFKPDMQMLNLRAAFHESLSDFSSAIRDCEAALCLDPNHKDTLELYNRARTQATCMHE